MKVSLITVCLNRANVIRQAIDSVFSQRDVDVEYIVIDGCSTDGTVGIIQSYSSSGRITYRTLIEPDSGMYDALNKGIHLSTGDVVGILNSDDRLNDDHVLADIVAAFKPETQAVRSDIRFDDAQGCCRRYYRAGFWRPWMFRFGYMPPHPGLYIRREWFEKLGYYRTDYAISADFELMLRFLVKARLRCDVLPRCSVVMLPGGISTKTGLATTFGLNAENIRACRENGYWTASFMMLPKYAVRLMEVLRGRLQPRPQR